MHLRTLEICVLKYTNLIPQNDQTWSAPGLAWQTVLKKTTVKWDLLRDIDRLLMVEKGIRGGIRHSI